ncbi:unnamed protein product [Leptosia nina]|uniref:RecQ-mediated genome instability protein 1 n=1 Tax=Leptosia nina TaxID=320188 RepID=A0AAV1JP21_9NEOP
MSLNSTINAVKAFLASNHMLVNDEWLTGCVEYLNEESTCTETEIRNLAKEQWLLNDLNDICPGSLPKDLKHQHKIVLKGRFVLQINAAVDIGTPAYQQYLKLQRINTENVEATTNFEEKVPNHRMIKLYMTDGIQEVTGIEYRAMRNLSCDITPGCKVLIKGPVECRRGMLLLTESSVELLGGEVQELAISNSLGGLLSTKLGLPIAENSNLSTTVALGNTHIPSPLAQVPSAQEVSVEPRNEYTTRPIARVTSIQVAHNDDDDIDIDQIAAIEEELSGTSNSSKTKTICQNKNDVSIKRPSDSFDCQPEKKFKVNNTDDYPDDNDLIFEDEDYLREMEASFDKKEIMIKNHQSDMPLEPFIYIKQLNELSNHEKVGRMFKIKGQIMKLLSKLSVGKDGWSLKCTLVDGSGAIDVEFTSDVLSKLVGLTPQEMTDIKKEIVNRPELKEKAVKALQKAKDTLQVLYCIIELTIFDTPRITQLIPFGQEHIHPLKRRQNKTLF